jgi:hypothetical protein
MDNLERDYLKIGCLHTIYLGILIVAMIGIIIFLLKLFSNFLRYAATNW